MSKTRAHEIVSSRPFPDGNLPGPLPGGTGEPR